MSSWWWRWRYARQAQQTPLASFYDPLQPDLQRCVAESELVALDFETSGLDENRDRLLSMGWVLISQGRVRMSTADHLVIRGNGQSVGQSATVHGLLDADIERGVDLERAMERLLPVLRGRTLVVHYSPIERGFLQRACRQLYGIPLPLQMIDTMGIEACRRAHLPELYGALRLHACRERYGLPRYRAHNAAIDALACAELLLAQVAHMGGARTVTLADLLRMSR